MPIPVGCRCGQTFAADDALAGKQVRCPKCRGVIAIPLAPAPSADPLGLGGLTPIESSAPAGYVPAQSPGYAPAPYAMPQGRPLGTPAQYGYGQPSNWQIPYQQPPPRSAGFPIALTIGLIGGFGVLLVGIAVVVVAVVINSRSSQVADDRVASGESTSKLQPLDESRTPTMPTLPAPTTPPTRPVTVTPSFPFGSTPATDLPAANIPEGNFGDPAPRVTNNADFGTPPTLAKGTMTWFGRSNTTLRGARPVASDDPVVVHFSWMCEVLPFLDQQSLYDRISFSQAWLEERNAPAAATIVPQFLNPGDNRTRWQGYPFEGVALTHFAGISGIEDRRNVVAATLPRSDPRAGVFGYGEMARAGDITDGTSQTIMIAGSGELAAPWIQGGGATVRGAREPYFDKITGFGSKGLPQPGALVVMADGSIRTINADVDPAVFRALCTIHGADSVDVSHLGPPLKNFSTRFGQ